MLADGFQRNWGRTFNSQKYALFQTDYYKSMVERCQRIDISLKPKFEATAELYRGRKISFWTSDPCKYISRVVSNPLAFLGLSSSLIKRLCLYVDDDSFSHRLPRYYRERILGRMPNLFKFAVQVALQQDACERYNQKLSQIASNLERTRPYSFSPQTTLGSYIHGLCLWQVTSWLLPKK